MITDKKILSLIGTIIKNITTAYGGREWEEKEILIVRNWLEENIHFLSCPMSDYCKYVKDGLSDKPTNKGE
jgi:hypothetical protein